MPSFKALTFNITGLTHNEPALNANVITTAGADLVALQECSSARMEAIVSELYSRGWAGQIWRYFAGHPDNGYNWGTVFIARVPLANPDHADVGGRRILKVTATVSGSALWAYCVHLAPGGGAADALSTYTYTYATDGITGSSRRLVLGDFNQQPAYVGMQSYWYPGASAFAEVDPSNQYTYPYSGPSSKIDYIWRTKGTLGSSSPYTIADKSSDHLALVATISF